MYTYLFVFIYIYITTIPSSLTDCFPVNIVARIRIYNNKHIQFCFDIHVKEKTPKNIFFFMYSMYHSIKFHSQIICYMFLLYTHTDFVCRQQKTVLIFFVLILKYYMYIHSTAAVVYMRSSPQFAINFKIYVKVST